MTINFTPGFIPSPIDKRDFISTAILPTDTAVPTKKMWNVPIIRNQGEYGACVGFGSAGLKNVQESVQGDYVDGGFSPLFIYSLCKQQDGMPNTEGTNIRFAMKNLCNIGIVSEKDLPYDLLKSPFGFPTITDTLKTKANPYKIRTYAEVPVQNVSALKQALQQSPVVSGVVVCDNFLTPEAGFVEHPIGYILGGHCILITGYDDSITHTFKNGKTKKGFFKFANSWGTEWGDKGYGYISYEDIMWATDLGMPFVQEMWSSIDITDVILKYLFKVQTNAFGLKTNAEKEVAKLKALNYPTYMPPKDADGLYRVQVGAFSVEDNAVTLRDKLRHDGFLKAYIKEV